MDTWEVSGIVNVPVVEDALYFRTSAYYQESDGFVENVNPVGGGSDTEFFTYRGALRFTPGDEVLKQWFGRLVCSRRLPRRDQ